MKKIRKETLIPTLVCLLPVFAGIALYHRLPETIATHFGVNGEENGWSGRAFTVFGMPAIMAGIHLLLQFGLSSDPKKQNMSSALRAISIWSVPLLSNFVSCMIFGRALGYAMHIEIFTPLLIGLLFIVVGNYLPKTKQSYTMGIKLPWTLASEENWNRTHRIAGFLWVLGGIATVLISILQIWNQWLFFAIVASLVIVPGVYSFFLYRKGI